MPVAILSSFSTRAGSRALAGGWGWSDAPQAGQPQTTRPQGPQPPSAAQSLGSGADPRAPSLDPPDSARPRRAGPPTAGNAQHTHDADDGGVDGQGRVHLDLLQCDAHDGQQDDGQVQLVPPGQRAGAAQRGPLCPPRHPPSPSSPEVSTLCPGRVLCHHRAACASPQRAATLSCLCDTPVLEESAEPKGHQLQRGLHDEDDGEHVVAVLEGLVQRLGARGRLVERQAPCPAAPPRPLALLCGPGPLRAGAGLPGAQLSLGGGLCQAGGREELPGFTSCPSLDQPQPTAQGGAGGWWPTSFSQSPRLWYAGKEGCGPASLMRCWRCKKETSLSPPGCPWTVKSSLGSWTRRHSPASISRWNLSWGWEGPWGSRPWELPPI